MTANFIYRLAVCASIAGSLLAQTSTPPAGSTKKAAAPAAKKPAAEAPATAPTTPPREPGLYTTITTSMGPIVVKLYEKESPITVKNFRDLALGLKEYVDPKTGTKVKKPLYNGLIFHRVIPGFMIQGGDPLGNGTGGTEPIPDEFNPALTFDAPGKLAMANAGPGTGSCQFFITEVPTPHLNGRHTIFGQVVEGQDLVTKITNVPRDPRDKPNTPVRIVRVTFNRVGPAPAGAVAAPKKAAPATGTGTTKKAAPATTKKAPAATKAPEKK